MSVGAAQNCARDRQDKRGRCGLPTPAARVGAHAYAGKRVRDEVREGAAVVLFSLGASTALVVALTLCSRWVG